LAEIEAAMDDLMAKKAWTALFMRILLRNKNASPSIKNDWIIFVNFEDSTQRCSNFEKIPTLGTAVIRCLRSLSLSKGEGTVQPPSVELSARLIRCLRVSKAPLNLLLFDSGTALLFDSGTALRQAQGSPLEIRLKKTGTNIHPYPEVS
jgi:hypothetical protein